MSEPAEVLLEAIEGAAQQGPPAFVTEEVPADLHQPKTDVIIMMQDPVPPPNPIQHPPQEPTFDYPSTARQEDAQYAQYLVSTAAEYPPILLETAANAAAANGGDTIALAAMQEAATIVMQAHEKMQYEQPYTYADANAIIRTDEMNGGLRKRALLGGDGGTEDQQQPGKKLRAPPAPRVSWDERLRQLQAYREEHGNLLVPTRYKGYMNLGKYVHNMREQYKVFHRQDYPKKCGLTDFRIRQLEEMGFQWTTKRHMKQEDDWGKRFAQLKSFKANYGHCKVPHGYEADPSFAEWVHRQRTCYHSMQKDKATNGKLMTRTMEERFEKLRQVGFLFQVQSDKWMDHWRQLKIYKEAHGDCQVPTHYAENPPLGRWVHTQRHQRRLQEKGRKSCMTQERIDLLDQLGFSWEVRPSLDRPRASWQHRLEELQAYAQQNGGSVEVDGDKFPYLHAWCVEQRQRLQWYDKNHGDDRRINPDRVKALNDIGFTKDTDLWGYQDSDNGIREAPSPAKPVGPPPVLPVVLELVEMDAGEVVDHVMGDTDLGGAGVGRNPGITTDDTSSPEAPTLEPVIEEASTDPAHQQPNQEQQQEQQQQEQLQQIEEQEKQLQEKQQTEQHEDHNAPPDFSQTQTISL